jgi:hypothetical protein
VSAMPRQGWGHPPVASGVGRVAWVADCSTTNPPRPGPGRLQGDHGHSAWERTSSAGQVAGRRYTALTDRLQQGWARTVAAATGPDGPARSWFRSGPRSGSAIESGRQDGQGDARVTPGRRRIGYRGLPGKPPKLRRDGASADRGKADDHALVAVRGEQLVERGRHVSMVERIAELGQQVVVVNQLASRGRRSSPPRRTGQPALGVLWRSGGQPHQGQGQPPSGAGRCAASTRSGGPGLREHRRCARLRPVGGSPGVR